MIVSGDCMIRDNKTASRTISPRGCLLCPRYYADSGITLSMCDLRCTWLSTRCKIGLRFERTDGGDQLRVERVLFDPFKNRLGSGLKRSDLLFIGHYDRAPIRAPS